MSFRKSIKRIGRKANGLLGKTPLGSAIFGNKEKEPADDAGQRAEAAKRLTNVQKQAGSGQIKYDVEETV